MATLSKDAPRSYEVGVHSDVGIIANDITYDGAAIGDNGSGYGRPLVAGDNFLGFALEKTDNTTSGPLKASGAAGDLNIRMQQQGKVELSISGLVITDVGKPVFASDDDVYVLTRGTNSFIGWVCRFVSAGKGIVRFDASGDAGMPSPLAVAFTIAAQSGNAITVNGQVNYASGQVVAERKALFWYLSDDSNGDTQGAPADGTDVTPAGGTDGLTIETLANQAGVVVTEADGDFDITLTKVATGAETVYLAIVLPDGNLVVSGAITFT